jgi:dTDP-4-amino-4,6-dideoxygalactose transaminase
MVSPRKFVGVPDGGVLISNCHIVFDHIVLNEAPLEWWLESFSASMMRRAFDKQLIQERTWFGLFQKKEASMPAGYYAMSEISRFLLVNSINFDLIAEKRRDNYLFLLKALKHIALFPELGKRTVPLGFPVCVENRDEVRREMFSRNIYPPVHWEIEGVVPSRFQDSHWLSERILTLPCDQRYDAQDMNRMIDVLKC